ncbi:uncharacterized protein LOC129225540 isoform X3 [Uloborus diversus]|uniref:uncharacterized protein LOC129225540 isoform X3 n=1 Tax=Uloborus diversus TaxID=327109 RepID=UPI002409C5F7|nr:uncharacterized protein LOC129225540 isoform X3 [Uloborus diversus]
MFFLGFILTIGIIPLHAFPGLDRCINQRMFAIILQLQSDLGKEDIDKLCPNILQIFDCLESLVVQRTGLTISEVAQLIPDETVQNGVKIFLNTRDTFNNLCTKGMPLNKGLNRTDLPVLPLMLRTSAVTPLVTLF